MKSRIRIPLILSLALLMCASFCSDASARPKKQGAVIPIFYVTDRNEDGEGYGSKRKYPLGCKHDMYYGTAFVEIPADARDMQATSSQSNTESSGSSKTNTVQQDAELLGWTFTQRVGDKDSKKDKIKESTPALEKERFFERVESALEQAKTDNLCIYVHGGASPFEDCAWDAANVAYQMACPTIMYSWPSVGNFDSYRIDEGNAEWSQEHYNEFLLDLEAFSKHKKVNVTLIAHSMGNRLVARSAGVLKNGTLIKDVELVSPDIDAETFAHYVMHYRNHGIKARLYVSDKDKILPCTQWLYGGYYRLGERMGAMLTMWSAPTQVWSNARAKMLKTTAALQKRRNQQAPTQTQAKAPPTPPVEAAPVPSDQGEQLTPGLERLDFTGIDDGFLGHRIPYQFIADMVKFGAPREGYSLVPVRPSSKGNWISRFARWKNDIQPLGNVSQNTCKRIIRVSKEPSGQPKKGVASNAASATN